MDLLTIIIYILISLVAILWLIFKYKFSYWKNLGVPYIKPRIPYGNLQGRHRRYHSAQLMQQFYNELKGNFPFGGLYFFFQPVVLILDLDLIKNIFIKDFHYFRDRGMYYNEKDDPISAHLFSVDGDKWKYLRQKLTPTFTSGKMKYMFSSVLKVCDEFVETLSEIIKTDDIIEMKELLARFTTDIIGTCAFGIDCNSLKDPNAEFRMYGKKVFTTPPGGAIKQLLAMTYKNLGRKLGITLTKPDVAEFFMRIVRETVEYREKNNIRRNDFMDLLIQLKNNESMTLNELTAQTFVFFLAGFETSSTTMGYALYELALNQDIQEKARTEINNVLEKYDGKITYEAMLEMEYITQIINESLRKYPPGANILRCASQDYIVPNTNVTIKKNMSVWIPVYAIQHDPEFYPDPEKFDPERFSPEEIKKRHTSTFLPFGDGPRNCIGLRFGMMQATLGLVTLLRNFRVRKSEKIQIPLEFSTTGVILTSKDGLWLKIEKL